MFSSSRCVDFPNTDFSSGTRWLDGTYMTLRGWAEVAQIQPDMLSSKWLTGPFTMIQRNLNNAFAYDLVPAPSVIESALKAARRVNDFATAVRVFEGTTA